MSKFLSKTLIKSGLRPSKNRFDLSSNLLTTQDYFKMKPCYIKECIPGEKVSINVSSITRLANLKQPFYGNSKILTRGFFVPFRTICEGWSEYIEDVPYTYGNSSTPTYVKIPTLTQGDLIYMFTSHSRYVADPLAVPESSITYDHLTICTDSLGEDNYDFRCGVTEYAPDGEYFTFTTKGRIFYDILLGLGYKINFGAESTERNVTFSALPLLAFAKVYADWFANRAYVQPVNLDFYFNGNWSQGLGADHVHNILNSIYKVCLRQDYFTSAFDNPVGPNQQGTTMTIKDNTMKNTSNGINYVTTAEGNQITTSYGTPYIAGSTTQTGISNNFRPNAITQNILNVLHKVTDYVTRHRLVGTRAIDRYLADYGFTLTADKLRRSVFLGVHDTPIQISDVMQTSPDVVGGDSLPSGVGSYTGKGVGFSANGKFEYESDEFGYIIITSYVDTHTSYVDGRPRMLQHGVDSYLDFFRGDFDGLGYQPIRLDELCANGFGNYELEGYKSDQPFGWINMYAEYKTAQDNMSGDFMLNSRNTDIDGWYQARRYNIERVGEYSLPTLHSLAFTQGQNADYINVFTDSSEWQDHFYTLFRFDVTSYMNAKPLYDMYQFDDDGKDIMMSVNGTNVVD